MRSGLGLEQLDHAAPRRRSAWPSRSRARTRSPGTRPRTNTTNPSARPTPAPAVGERVDRRPRPPPRASGGALVAAGPASLLCSQAAWPSTWPPIAREAEEFLSAIDREYYLHYSGQQDEFEIEPIYDRHAGLFSRESVEGLREAGAPRRADRVRGQGLHRPGDEGASRPSWRAARPRSSSSGTARRCRSARPPCCRPTSPTRPPRASSRTPRNELTAAELNPLTARAARALARASRASWAGRPMRDVRGALGHRPARAGASRPSAFLDATEDAYEALVEPELRATARAGLRPAAALRPHRLLPRPVARRGLPGGAARAVAHRDARRDGHRRGRAAGRDDRHRAAAEEVAARLLRPGARAGRGVPRDRPRRRARGLRRAVPRGRAHRALRARGRRRCRSRTATWATTR